MRSFTPELVMFRDFLSFEHPSVLLFCFVKVRDAITLHIYVFYKESKTVILKNATPLVENRVAHILSFLKSTSFIFLNIFFVQYDN